MLEFTTTATERPELLYETYDSFFECFEGPDPSEHATLYINVDPVPYDSEAKRMRVLEIARTFFADVEHRIGPCGGSFSQAINWLFQQPSEEFFFHLEDDWRFEGTVPLDEYVEAVRGLDNGLQCVTYNNGGGNRFHMPPSLIRTQLVQDLISRNPVPVDANPEQHIIENLGDCDVTCHAGVDRQDLGRRWSQKVGVEKDLDWGGPGHFIKWDTSNVSE